MSTFNAVERTAQTIARFGAAYLSVSEESALQNNAAFRRAVEERVAKLKKESDANETKQATEGQAQP